MSESDSMGVRLELQDSSKVICVRDYFRRLGANATIQDGDGVEVQFPEGSLSDSESIEEYLYSWSTTNGVGARATMLSAVPANVVPLARPASSPSTPPPRLGDLLVAKGYLTEEQLSAALVESKSAGEILGRTLIRNGFVFESELARTLAEQWGLPYVSLANVGVDPQAVQVLPRVVGERYAAIPVRRMAEGTQVAFVDPSDEETAAAVREYIPAMSVAVADSSDILMAWRSFPR